MIELIEIMSAMGMVPQQGQGAEGGGGLLGSPIFLIIMIFVLFYFILYRPEKRRKQQREEMLKSLERGDEVITGGGIYGKITAITDKAATVEVAPNVRIKVSRQQLTKAGVEEPAKGKASEAEKEKDEKKGQKKGK